MSKFTPGPFYLLIFIYMSKFQPGSVLLNDIYIIIAFEKWQFGINVILYINYLRLSQIATFQN